MPRDVEFTCNFVLIAKWKTTLAKRTKKIHLNNSRTNRNSVQDANA
nr:hypothetical protein [Mycoplasmopsis bovis]